MILLSFLLSDQTELKSFGLVWLSSQFFGVTSFYDLFICQYFEILGSYFMNDQKFIQQTSTYQIYNRQILIQFQILFSSQDICMKYFLSLIWILLTLLSVYAVNQYMSDTDNKKGSVIQKKLQTHCLKWSTPDGKEGQNSEMKKYCVHCLKKRRTNQQKQQKNENYLSEFSVNTPSRMKFQPLFFNSSFSIAYVFKPLELECSQYLHFIDIQTTNEKRDIIHLQESEKAQKIMRLLQIQHRQIRQIRRQGNTVKFNSQNLAAEEIVIIQKMDSNVPGQIIPINPSQVSILYEDSDYILSYFKQVLNYFLFAFVFIVILMFILQKRKDGRLENYQNLLPGTILTYICLVIYLYKLKQNILVQSAAWAITIWNLLIKLDNVDKNSYNFSKITYFFISIFGGFSIWVSEFTDNIVLELSFWVIFLMGYLMAYKLVMRIWCHNKRFENDSTIGSLAYVVAVSLLIIETLCIQQIYGKSWAVEIQISKYTALISIPIILILMTFCENEEKIQKFQEYTRETQNNEQQILEQKITNSQELVTKTPQITIKE